MIYANTLIRPPYQKLRHSVSVNIKNFRYVRKVGYDKDFDYFMTELAQEAEKNFDSIIHSSHCIDSDYDHIILGCEAFKNYRENIREELTKVLDKISPAGFKESLDTMSLPNGGGNNFQYVVEREIVKEYIKKLLKKAIKEGNDRKLYFENLPQDVKPGPYIVEQYKCVQTGKYERGYYCGGFGDEYDYVPPELSERKDHVIYIVKMFRNWRWEEYPILKSDCEILTNNRVKKEKVNV